MPKSKLNPPVDKRCKICNQIKLLAEFEFNDKKRDKHESVRKDCVQKQEEAIDHSCGICYNCIESEYLQGIYHSLVSLLGHVKRKNVCVPGPILDAIIEIVKEDAANHENGSCRRSEESS